MNSKSSPNPFEQFIPQDSRLIETKRRQHQAFAQAIQDGRVRVGRLYAPGDLPALRKRYGITEEDMFNGWVKTDQFTKDEERRFSGRIGVKVRRYWIKEEFITKHIQPQDAK
jgi:hypothetical protein